MSVNTLSAALSAEKGPITESLGVAAAYANDLVEIKDYWYAGNAARMWLILNTAAISAANLNADTAGYAKAPGKSVAFINSSGIQRCIKGGTPDDTTGTWVMDS